LNAKSRALKRLARRINVKRRDALVAISTASFAPVFLSGCAEFGRGYDDKDIPREAPILWPEGKSRTALVLGSGGPRGFAHVGVLKALEANQIEPTLIVGASAGAIVGSLYAAKISATRIETLALNLGIREVVDPSLLRPNRFIGRSMQNTINDQVRVNRIEELPRCFAAVAACLSPRKLVAFTAGNIGAAVRASAALPEYFLPTMIGNLEYEDGDILSPVPIRMARQLGAARIIAVDVSAWKEDEPSYARDVWRKRDAERRAIIDDESKDADLLLRIRLPYLAGMSRDYRENVIALGESQTAASVERIRALIAA
jgi:NTE family protein